MSEIQDMISEYTINNDKVVVAGDLNTIDCCDKEMHKSDKCTSKFEYLKKQLKLIDSWKYKNNNITAHTYIEPSSRFRNSRIDYILVSTAMKSFVCECNIVQAPAPDHKAVVCKLSLNERKRGAGYWKMNCEILNEKEYVACINELIDQIDNDYGKEVNKLDLWEYMKIKIKETSVRYCIKRSKLKVNRVIEIEKLLDKCDQNITKDPTNVLHRERSLLKAELDNI